MAGNYYFNPPNLFGYGGPTALPMRGNPRPSLPPTQLPGLPYQVRTAPAPAPTPTPAPAPAPTTQGPVTGRVNSLLNRYGLMVTDGDKAAAAWKGLMNAGAAMYNASAPSTTPGGGLMKGVIDAGQAFTNTYDAERKRGVAERGQNVQVASAVQSLDTNQLAADEAAAAKLAERLYAAGDLEGAQSASPNRYRALITEDLNTNKLRREVDKSAQEAAIMNQILTGLGGAPGDGLSIEDAAMLDFVMGKGAAGIRDLNKPVAVLDRETGEQVYVSQKMLTNSERYVPIPKSSLSVEVLDKNGNVTRVRSGSGGKDALAMHPSTTKSLEEIINSASTSLAQVSQMRRDYNPVYQTIGYRGRQWWSSLKSRTGSPLSQDEYNDLSQYVDYRSTVGRHFSLLLKELSGGAVTDGEAARAKVWIPDVGTGLFDGDDPVELETKIKNMEAFLKMSLARASYLRRVGNLTMEDVSLDRMPQIMSERAREIADSYASRLSPTDLEAAVKRQLAEEFGIPAI